MSKLLLDVKHIRVNYIGGYKGLDDVSLVLKEGERLIVYGLDGCGKTTLLRTLAGLEEYDGEIMYDGTNIDGISLKDRNIGFTFDKKSLDKNKTVYQILSYPMRLRQYSTEDTEIKVKESAQEFSLDLNIKAKDLQPFDVAKLLIARLFSVERKLYLIDNIADGLDEKQKEIIYGYIKSYTANKSAVIATDDKEFVKSLVEDDILVLSDGVGEGQGRLRDMALRPLNITSAALCGYELYTGVLLKSQDKYYGVPDGNEQAKAQVAAPISDVYVNKQVCFALKDNKIQSFYYDMSCERIISRQ